MKSLGTVEYNSLSMACGFKVLAEAARESRRHVGTHSAVLECCGVLMVGWQAVAADRWCLTAHTLGVSCACGMACCCCCARAAVPAVLGEQHWWKHAWQAKVLELSNLCGSSYVQTVCGPSLCPCSDHKLIVF